MRNDTQLVILSFASRHPQGRAFPFPRQLTGDVNQAAEDLVSAGLLHRVRLPAPAGAWKTFPRLGPVTLEITPKGLKEINA